MKYDKKKLKRAHRILEIAKKVTVSTEAENHIEEMHIHVCGYIESGCSVPESGLIATGNWNSITKYNQQTRESVEVDDTPKRLSRIFEKMGIEIEWSDEWEACNDCAQLYRVSPDSYGWRASYVEMNGERVCWECADPEEFLESIEGEHTRACALTKIDPANYGYTLLEGDFESGWHPGQDASPKIIARALEDQGIARFLFKIDDVGQFDLRFSVYVHDDELEKVDKKAFKAANKDGPSNSNRLQAQLQEASSQINKLQGEGIKYSKMSSDGSVTTRLVSSEEFIKGIKD